MIIDSIEISNFGVFKYCKLEDLSKKKVISILGKTEDNTEKSNRSGKTTLLNAVMYAICGTEYTKTRDENKLISNEAEGDMNVTVNLLQNEEIITIKRGRTKNGIPLLEVSGGEGLNIKDKEEHIKKLIGISTKHLGYLNYFAQGDINGFMQADSKFKEDLISAVSKIDLQKLKNIKKTCLKKLRDISEETKKLTTLSTAMKEQLDGLDFRGIKKQHELNQARLTQAKKQLDEKQNEIDLVEEKLRTLKKKL